MKIFRVFSRRTKYILSAATLVLTFIAPTLFTGFASAAEITERSVELSSSSASATAQTVSYTVNFTATQAAGAFVVDFCDSASGPVAGHACDAPTGFDASHATIGSTDDGGAATAVGSTTTPSNSTVVVTDTITQGHQVSVELKNITNPTSAGTIYARIATYDTASNAQGYSATGVLNSTGYEDSGSVAIAITSDLNVSGEVQESLLFCQSSDPITEPSCGDAHALKPVHLGTQVGTGDNTSYVLGTTVSSSQIYTQISTNAVNGAVVRLKSDAAGCGGLYNTSVATRDAAHCYIKPGAVANDSALFGLKLGTEANDSEATTHGVVQAANGSAYTDSAYSLNYVAGDATGVTSPYGDPVLDTNGAPADSQTMPLYFGAAVTNETPAGNYSADLSLIATGTF